MSTVSQTPALTRWSFGRRLALGLVITAAILALAIGRFWGGIVYLAAHAHPHVPVLSEVMAWPLVIRIHVACAFGALALGATLMLVRKGRLFHRTAGWVWVSLVSVVAGSSIFMTSLNHGRLSVLHLFTGWTLIVLPLAVIAAKRHDVARHRRTMMGLFYGGFAINSFIAFIPGRALWNLVFA
jgi:uncharacterized membrane protein